MRIVGQDAQNHAGRRVMLLNLQQLNVTIKGHEVNTDFTGIADVADRLCWVGEDDAAWINTKLEHVFDFPTRSAVKPGAQRHQRLENLGLVATLHGIKGLHARKHALPLLVLAVNAAQLDDKKGFTVGGILVYNTLDRAANRIAADAVGRNKGKADLLVFLHQAWLDVV